VPEHDHTLAELVTCGELVISPTPTASRSAVARLAGMSAEFGPILGAPDVLSFLRHVNPPLNRVAIRLLPQDAGTASSQKHGVRAAAGDSLRTLISVGLLSGTTQDRLRRQQALTYLPRLLHTQITAGLEGAAKVIESSPFTRAGRIN
jgi:hypothetical protein